MSNITYRAIQPDEVAQVHAIFAHYVTNTMTSLCCEPPPVSVIASKHKSASERKLPYLVAVDSSSHQDNTAAVLGYAYALPFRAQSSGYAPSVEISVFVHPSHLYRGIGTRLLESLLDELRSAVHHAAEPGHEDKARDVQVRNVFAIMAYTTDEPDTSAGDKLVAWYQRFGFEVVGRLKNVGYKHGRWADTVYLQMGLESWISPNRRVPHEMAEP